MLIINFLNYTIQFN